jgi:hypothetical protein
LLIGAPFTGTTTTPLSAHQHNLHRAAASERIAAAPGTALQVPLGSVAELVAAQLMLLSVAGGVFVVARRRRDAEG